MRSITRLRTAAVALTAVAALTAGCGDRNRNTTDQATNQTELNPVITTMDDDRIVAAVRSDYFASDQIKEHDIDVSSDQGVVTLKGTVPSEAVHQQAVALAKDIDGVKRVDDQLRVQAASASASTAAAANRDDEGAAWVTTRILAQYYVNPELKPWNIDVSTSRDGVVTLEGKIDNDQDRAEAVRIAKSTEGVKDVRDRLRAGDVAATAGTSAAAGNAAADLSDGWITTKIKARFFMDPDVKGRDINVDAKDGVVVLRGTVGSYSARRQAVNMARSTDGVHEVRDELRVDTSRDSGSASATNAGRKVDDGWITTKIQSKYFSDADVQASGINVTTKGGVVTLSGTVASKEAKDTAVQLARDTDGVRSVRDRLTIKAAAASTQH